MIRPTLVELWKRGGLIEEPPRKLRRLSFPRLGVICPTVTKVSVHPSVVKSAAKSAITTCVRPLLKHLTKVLDRMGAFMARTMFGKKRHIVDCGGWCALWVREASFRSAIVWHRSNRKYHEILHSTVRNLSKRFIAATEASRIARFASLSCLRFITEN